MKKILEVLQYGDHDIRFNTDIDVQKKRALIIADLGISVNREEMVEMMADAAEQLAQAMNEAREAMNRDGIKIQVFGPGITPPDNPS